MWEINKLRRMKKRERKLTKFRGSDVLERGKERDIYATDRPLPR